MGRPRKPAALKELMGDPGKRTTLKDRAQAANPDPPQPVVRLASEFDEAPSRLPPPARNLWNTLGRKLFEAKLLTVGYQTPLENLCEALASLHKVRRAIETQLNGIPVQTVETANGPVARPHPLAKLDVDLDNRVRHWWTLMGISPRDIRANALDKVHEVADPIEDFL